MVYVFLANGFEEVEAITPIDLLRRASVDVKTVGIGSKQITGSHGMTIFTDLSDEDDLSESFDMLILPGGVGHVHLKTSPVVKTQLEKAVENQIPIGAICAAPSILGEYGFLQNHRAVCFPGFETSLLGATYVNQPVVTDGIFTTAKGAGCALLFSFELIRILCGEVVSKEIQEGIQYAGF